MMFLKMSRQERIKTILMGEDQTIALKLLYGFKIKVQQMHIFHINSKLLVFTL